MAEYTFQSIEKKWQAQWQEKEVYKVVEDTSKPKYYILDMFPYPSGAGLHVGHPLGYIATDIIARYKRLKGFNVLHPMGFDSFGLPAEQYAIQTGQHPALTTENNINRYKEQLRALGFSYDWSRELRTSDPAYYKWTQWIFKLIYNAWYNNDTDKAEPIETLIEKLSKEGNENINAACDDDTPVISASNWNNLSTAAQQQILLKYRLTYLANTTVNWCPALGTVLSNDEVKDGFSERGGHPVVKKDMPQWNMRITAYADRLLSGLDNIDWPAPIKEMQRNWIGKSFGAQVDFQVDGHDEKITVFTTRIDTIFGVTFMVLAPESDLTAKLTTADQEKAVKEYVEIAKNRSERERMSDAKNVTGVFSGSYALHPFTGDKVPIWIADYVLADYGTGAVMAVPSGDQRDFDFAKKFDLPIVQINEAQVITETEADPTKEGKVINSDFLNGLSPIEAMDRGSDEVEKRGLGKRKINFKLRDAIFGRQRYWGEPIPVFYDNNVPELVDHDALPLELPKIEAYLPTEDGDPPLGRATDWSHGGQPYELSTMPGWAGSSWYFFRYMDPNNDEAFCGEEALKYWKEVDFYLGGPEHATGHLLYSRFWTKFLFDLGIIEVDEYAKKLVNQGMIQGRSNFAYRVNGENKYVSKGLKGEYNTTPIHVDVNMVKDDVMDVEAFKKFRPDAADAEFILEDGKFHCGWEVEKMSKSKYNVVNPDDLVEKYGADTLRMYEMFLGPIEQSKPWNTNGIEGVYKFLKKFWALFHTNQFEFSVSDEKPTDQEYKIMYGTLKKNEDDINRLSLNTVVSNYMIATKDLGGLKCNKREILEPLVIGLAPFAPHMAEELWHLLGNEGSVVTATYPEIKEEYLKEDAHEYPVSINGKMRVKLPLSTSLSVPEIEEAVLANEVVQKWLDGKSPKKMIVIPKRIVNVVL